MVCMVAGVGLLAIEASLNSLRPPHFPDPSADPVAILEARILELEEINSAQFAELNGWRTQLEVALARVTELEARK